MSEALRHMPREERLRVIRRRLNGTARGLGYLSAVAADRHERKKQSDNVLAERVAKKLEQ